MTDRDHFSTENLIYNRGVWSPLIILAGALAFAPVVSAAYSNLVATADGKAVYFQAQTGVNMGSPANPNYPVTSYVMRLSDSGPMVQALDGLADVNASGTVLAFARNGFLHCQVYGSEACSFLPLCSGTFSIRGTEFSVSVPQDNFSTSSMRLDRAGRLLWIETGNCGGTIGGPHGPPYYGLYSLPSMQRIPLPNAAGNLAPGRSSRRAITERGQVLLVTDNFGAGRGLQWGDPSGSYPITSSGDVHEAVTDAAGANIVYNTFVLGHYELHWVADGDEDLALRGTAPALSDDGNTLAFLAPDGSLQIYDRASRVAHQLGGDRFLEFTLGGNAVFGVTTDGRLVRIDLVTGETVTWLPPLPAITSEQAQSATYWLCSNGCYSPLQFQLLVSPGMILVLGGSGLDQPDLHARVGGVNVAFGSYSSKSAWLQIPTSFPPPSEPPSSRPPIEIFYPSYYPLAISVDFGLESPFPTCLGTLHQDFSRSVSSSDPALLGEIVHVFLTGVAGVESVPDGAPNPTDHLVPVASPPALSDPAAAEVLFFVLAPGLIGIEQLDLQIQHPWSKPSTPLFASRAYLCVVPPIGAAIP